MQTLELIPYSDDVVELEIREGDKIVYANEFSPGRPFRINDDFTLTLAFGTDGWTARITDLAEDHFQNDSIFNDFYTVLVIPNRGVYGPGFKVTYHSEDPIKVAGIIGDKKSEVIKILEDVIDRNYDVDVVISKLEAKGLLAK